MKEFVESLNDPILTEKEEIHRYYVQEDVSGAINMMLVNLDDEKDLKTIQGYSEEVTSLSAFPGDGYLLSDALDVNRTKEFLLHNGRNARAYTLANPKKYKEYNNKLNNCAKKMDEVISRHLPNKSNIKAREFAKTLMSDVVRNAAKGYSAGALSYKTPLAAALMGYQVMVRAQLHGNKLANNIQKYQDSYPIHDYIIQSGKMINALVDYYSEKDKGFLTEKKEEQHRQKIYDQVCATLEVYTKYMKASNDEKIDEDLHKDDVIDGYETVFTKHIYAERGLGTLGSCLHAYKMGLENGWALEDIAILASYKSIIDRTIRVANGYPFDKPNVPKRGKVPGYASDGQRAFIKEMQAYYDTLKTKKLNTPEERQEVLAGMFNLVSKGMRQGHISSANDNQEVADYFYQQYERKKIMDKAIELGKTKATFKPIPAKNLDAEELVIENPSLLKENQPAKEEEKKPEQEVKEEEKPANEIEVEEKPANEIKVEEKPANEIKEEEKPAEDIKVEEKQGQENPPEVDEGNLVVGKFAGLLGNSPLGFRHKMSRENLLWLGQECDKVSDTHHYTINRRISPDNSLRMMLMADHNMTMEQTFDMSNKTGEEINTYFREFFDKVANPNKTPAENVKELGKMKAKAYRKINESTIPSFDEPITEDKIKALKSYFDHFCSMEIDIEQDYEEFDSKNAYPELKAAFYEGVGPSDDYVANKARIVALGQGLYPIVQILNGDVYDLPSKANALYLVKDFFKKYGGKKISEIDTKEFCNYYGKYNSSAVNSVKKENNKKRTQAEIQLAEDYLTGKTDTISAATEKDLDEIAADIEMSSKKVPEEEVQKVADKLLKEGLQKYKGIFTDEVLSKNNLLELPKEVKDQINAAYYNSLGEAFHGAVPHILAPVARNEFDLFRIPEGPTIREYVDSHYRDHTPEEKYQAMVLETMRQVFSDGVFIDSYHIDSDNNFNRINCGKVSAVSEASLDAREISEFEKRLSLSQVDREKLLRAEDGTYIKNASELSEEQINKLADIYDDLFGPIFSRDAVKEYKNSHQGVSDLDFFRVGGVRFKDYIGAEKLREILEDEEGADLLKAEIVRLATDPSIPFGFVTVRHNTKTNTFKETEPYRILDVADVKIAAMKKPFLSTIDTFKDWYKNNTIVNTSNFDEEDWNDLYQIEVRKTFEADAVDKNVTKESALQQISLEAEKTASDVNELRAFFNTHAENLKQTLSITKRDLKGAFHDDITPEISRNSRVERAKAEYMLVNTIALIQKNCTVENFTNIYNSFNKIAKEKGWKERPLKNNLGAYSISGGIEQEQIAVFVDCIFKEIEKNPSILSKNGNLKEQILGLKTPLEQEYKNLVEYPADKPGLKETYTALKNKAKTQEEKDLIDRVNENLAERTAEANAFLSSTDTDRPTAIDHNRGQIRVDNYANGKFGPIEGQTNDIEVGHGIGLKYKLYKNPEFLNELKATPTTMTDESKAVVINLLHKIKELGLVDKDSQIEQSTKQYIHAKLVKAKEELKQAVRDGDLNKIREANEKYEAEREKVREIFTLTKQSYGDSILAPANLSTLRNPMVPLEFSGDILTESKVNGLYQTACICEKLGITPEEFVANPINHMSDYIMKAADKAGFNANNKQPDKRGFVYSFEALFRKGAKLDVGGKLANDMGLIKPSLLISRTIDGYSMLEKDSERRADLHAYSLLAIEVVDNLIDIEEAREKAIFKLFTRRDKEQNKEAYQQLKEGLKSAFLEGGNIQKKHVPIELTDMNGKVIPKPGYQNTLNEPDRYKAILENYKDVVRTYKDVIKNNNNPDNEDMAEVPVEELCHIVEESMFDYLMAHPEDSMKPEYKALEKAALNAHKELGFTDPVISPASEKYNKWKRDFAAEQNALYGEVKEKDKEVNKSILNLQKKLKKLTENSSLNDYINTSDAYKKLINDRMEELALDFRFGKITENYFTERIEDLILVKESIYNEPGKLPKFMDESNPEVFKRDCEKISKRIKSKSEGGIYSSLEEFKKWKRDQFGKGLIEPDEISKEEWDNMYHSVLIDKGLIDMNAPLPAGYKEIEGGGIVNEKDGVRDKLLDEFIGIEKPEQKRKSFESIKKKLLNEMKDENGLVKKHLKTKNSKDLFKKEASNSSERTMKQLLAEAVTAECYERMKGKLPKGVSEEVFRRRLANSESFKQISELLLNSLYSAHGGASGKKEEHKGAESIDLVANTIIRLVENKSVLNACLMHEQQLEKIKLGVDDPNRKVGDEKSGISFIRNEYNKAMKSVKNEFASPKQEVKNESVKSF